MRLCSVSLMPFKTVFGILDGHLAHSIVSGLEAVDTRKRSRIIRTADCYLNEYITQLQPRYDIAEVMVSRGESVRVLRIDIYEDAFDTEGIYTIN